MHRSSWVLAAAVGVVASQASAGDRTEAVWHRLVRPGVWTVILDPGRPEGALVNVEQPAVHDVTAYCQQTGYRVSQLGDEKYDDPTQAVLRKNVAVGAQVLGNPDGKPGVVTEARAACLRGDASFATKSLLVPWNCKKVKTTYEPYVTTKGFIGPVEARTVVQVKCQGFPKPQDKLPLWLSWSPGAQNNDSSTNAAPRAGDWVYVRIQGDLWKDQQPGTVALKRWKKEDGTGDFLYTTKPPPPGYKDAGTLGYVYEPGKQPPGTVSLTRYWSSARKDWHLNERADFNPAAEGYEAPVLEGYLFSRE